jgi:tetratricopeptide (TPR) repeat protein
MEKIVTILREALPEVVGTLIAAAILSAVGIAANFVTSNLLVTFLIVAIAAWLICCFFYFKRGRSMIKIPSRGKTRQTKSRPYQFPRLRLWALMGMIIIPIMIIIGVVYQQYSNNEQANKSVILIADFDGPNPENYRVTETVLAQLRKALKDYKDFRIVPLGHAITEDEGSEVAITEGQKYKATVVVWGWYGVTENSVPLSINFELTDRPNYSIEMCPLAKGEVRNYPRTELEELKLQFDLSKEISYLALITVGVAHYAVEDWQGAVVSFSDALKYLTEDTYSIPPSDIFYYRGTAYFFLENYSAAKADFDKSIEINLNSARSYFYRGLTLEKLGEFDAAQEDFDRLSALDLNNEGFYTYLGDYQAFVRQDIEAAIEYYSQAITINDKSPCNYTNRGLAYLAVERLNLAKQDFDQALDINPNTSAAYFGLGLIYLNQSDFQAATNMLNRAIEIDPEYGDAYYWRAYIHQINGRNEAAVDDLRKALEYCHDDFCSHVEAFLNAIVNK